MMMRIVGLSILAATLGVTQAVFADDASQVQRRSTTQETYSPGTSMPGSTTPANSSAGSPSAGAALPSSPGIQISTPTALMPGTTPAVGTPLAQRTVTQEETIVAQNNPPVRWSVLEGQVSHVDKVNNVVEIRLKGSNHYVGIPVSPNRVGIYQHGDHQYALKDIEPGDNITLRNLNTSSM